MFCSRKQHGLAKTCEFLTPFISCNISNICKDISKTQEAVSSHFQTPRREFKIRRAAKYFLTNFELDRGAWKCNEILPQVFDTSL